MFTMYTEDNVPKSFATQPYYNNNPQQQYVQVVEQQYVPKQQYVVEPQYIVPANSLIVKDQQQGFYKRNSKHVIIWGCFGVTIFIVILLIIGIVVISSNTEPYGQVYSDDQWG